MNVVFAVALAMLLASTSLCLVRLIRPGTLADKILALDTILIIVVVGIALSAAQTGSDVYLNALFVVSLVAFISSVTVARFIETRRDLKR